jgi:hypothetical protein
MDTKNQAALSALKEIMDLCKQHIGESMKPKEKPEFDEAEPEGKPDDKERLVDLKNQLEK